MPLIAILRPLFGLISLAIPAAAGYLLWSWYEGDFVRYADGALYRVRDDWRLWAALALLAWSLFGKFVVTLLLARGDKGPKTRPERGEGLYVQGASGAHLYVETYGDASNPTLILTHGWGLDSTIWGYAKRELASHYRLILWDLPGLGRSKLAKDGVVSLPNFAADLGSLITWSQADKVILVGHSIGGMTIQTLARDQPQLFADRVAAAVLLNTTYTNPLKTMVMSGLVQALRHPVIEPMMRLMIWLEPLAWLMSWHGYLNGSAHLANRFGFGRFVTRSQLEHTTLLATRNRPGVQAKGNLAMFRWDVTPALPAIPGPVLVIGGNADIVTKLEASQTIAASVPEARLQVVEAVNHMGFLERADIYNPAIAQFGLSTALPSMVAAYPADGRPASA